MSHSGADGATTTLSRNTMAQPSPAGPAAAESGASEEPPIFALPVELQKTVVKYLTSYRDMKSVCLVCKQLNAIATPYLYRKMEITGEFLDSDRFKTAITTKSPGLPSVKTVRIVHHYPRSGRIGQAACLLLSKIPRNSLARFKLPVPTSPRVAREIFDFVRLKQGRVDNHQYDSFCLRDRYGHREAFAADVNYLARVKHLRLRLWEELDSRQAEIMLNSMHELTSLDVGLRKACFTGDPILLHLVIRAFSDCVRTASALVVLKLTMWVNCDAIPTRNDASTKALVKEAQNMAQRREHTAKRTADKIFSTLASDCPRLNVVVIETAWQYGWDDEFVRAFLK
ncbi:hypothetical protein MBLNU13_g11116t1 [Cladosporium sp. NU13]